VTGAGGQWYFILPDGSLYRWDGSTAATGALVATLDSSYWADPSTLYNATPGTVPATVTTAGNVVTITTDAGFVGAFGVRVTVSDGTQSATQLFKVTRTAPVDRPPVLAAIADQTLAAGQTSLTVPLSASDPDGDPLAYSAGAVSLAYYLDQTLGLATDGNLWLNWGGRNEKWVTGAGGQWYFILPDGSLYRWDGSTAATGTFVAYLGPSYWSDPSTLYNATNTPVPVTLSFSGNQLTVTPNSGFDGSFRVTVTVDDGRGGSASQSFNVTVKGG
jgi:hypothetical protein